MKKTVLLATLALAIFMAGNQPVFADQDNAPRRSVTLWWVIFNNPDACNADPGGIEQCGPVDVFGADFLESVALGAPDPSLIAPNTDSKIAVLHATGGRTEANGQITLVASIYKTPSDVALSIDNAVAVADPMGLGSGFSSDEAEVHLVVRDHGRWSSEAEFQQITSFLDPYCSDPNLLFYAGDNICADIQFAIFAPGESGPDAVMMMGAGSEVDGASAHLIRNGDALQVVLKTRVRNR